MARFRCRFCVDLYVTKKYHLPVQFCSTVEVKTDSFVKFQKKWLKYWTVYAGFLAAETVGDALLLQYIIPGYLLLKLSFLLWAASPWTEGASVIHQKVTSLFFPLETFPTFFIS